MVTFGSRLALFVPVRPDFAGNRRIVVSLQVVLDYLRQTLSKIWTAQANYDGSGRYNSCVARGWESKSVEEQQAEAVATPSPAKPPLTPAQIASQRQRQGLLLSRQHVLQQLEAAGNPRHRELLQGALADLDARLARMV
jgi:hypothetical protein